MRRSKSHHYSITSSARSRNDFRDCQPERFGGGQIDDEIELGRLIDRDIARLRPAQNFVSIVGGTLKLVREVWSIGDRRQACG